MPATCTAGEGGVICLCFSAVLLGAVVFTPWIPEKCLASSTEWLSLGSLNQTKERTVYPHHIIRKQLNANLHATNTRCRKEREWRWLKKLEKVFARELGIREGEGWEACVSGELRGEERGSKMRKTWRDNYTSNLCVWSKERSRMD